MSIEIAVYLFMALVAGFTLPTQAGINAQLNLWARSAVLASAVSFAVGTLALVFYALAARVPLPSMATVADQPWWVWIGGILGAFFVASTVVLAPKLGAASMVGFIVAGQMLASLMLDHFGWLGYSLHPANPFRLIGAALITAGVVLIRIY